MNSLSRLHIVLGTALITLLLAVVAARVVAAPEGRQGPVVLLRNGHVLYGEPTNLGDRYVITLREGGEVRVAAKQVVIACETLDEAYQHLAQGVVSLRGPRPHLELAKWCVRQKLFAAANEQLAAAEARQATPADLDTIRRQLEHAQQQAALPSAAAQRPAAPTPAISAAAKARADLSTEQLERTMNALSKDTVHMFTNAIQPLLLNRCTGGRCHDANSQTGLALLRPTAGTQIWRRLTLRNLHATMEHVNRLQPQESMLLLMSRQPHGGTGAGVLAEDSAAYQQLHVWIHRAAGARRTDNNVRLASAEAPLPADTAAEPPAPAQENAVMGEPSLLPAAAASARALPVMDSTVIPPAAEGDNSSGGQPADNTPRDAFDPEIFNRRFGAETR